MQSSQPLHSDLIQLKDNIGVVLDQGQHRLARTLPPIVTGLIGIVHLIPLDDDSETKREPYFSSGLTKSQRSSVSSTSPNDLTYFSIRCTSRFVYLSQSSEYLPSPWHDEQLLS